MQPPLVLYPQYRALTFGEIMSACQPLCSDRLKHSCCCCYCCCPPPPLSPLYMRKDGMIDTQVGIVAPFAYSVGGVASPVFIRWQKIIIKKSPADSQSDEGAGSSRRLFILKRRPPLVSETSPPGRCLVLLSHGKTV